MLRVQHSSAHQRIVINTQTILNSQGTTDWGLAVGGMSVGYCLKIELALPQNEWVNYTAFCTGYGEFWFSAQAQQKGLVRSSWEIQ